jgi:hypothetical protein
VAGASPGVALRSRFPGCLVRRREALAIGRTVIPETSMRSVSRASAAITDARSARMGPARVVARSLAFVALALFAILVLLPAVVAAQATVPI